MSLRLQMLQVARLAPRILGDSIDLCRRFLLSQINGDGGFKDRSGKSDLYYTVFGLDALAAVEVSGFDSGQPTPPSKAASQEPLSRTRDFLRSFSDGAELDLVHLCCLARCRAAVGSPNQLTTVLGERLAKFRSADGGFNPMPGSEDGTAYGAFLGAGAYQDCGLPLPQPLRLVQSLKLLETADGAWTNEHHSSKRIVGAAATPAQGATNATAAAVILLRNMGFPVNQAVGDWLLARVHPQGGFCATPVTPAPDLLSTATALHALAALEIPLIDAKEKCLDFIDSLWTNAGGFYGHWNDDCLDCEYLYYGLLALGHLSL